MRAVAGALVVGFLAARLAWAAMGPLFALPALTRQNYRGRPLPTATGIVLPVAALLVEAGRAVAGVVGVGDPTGITGGRALVLLAVCGFALLGAIDDVAGSSQDRGLKAHLRALTRGRLTTGGLKMVGGAAVAVVVAGPAAGGSLARLMADAALVALSANLLNLLDRAPGRAIKVGGAGFVVLALTTGVAHVLGAVGVVVGAATGLLLDDLSENLMLGDAGANALGAVVGLGAVMSCGPRARDVLLVVVTAFNVVGDLVSFSKVIDAVPPLRALDRVGRRRTDPRAEGDNG